MTEENLVEINPNSDLIVECFRKFDWSALSWQLRGFIISNTVEPSIIIQAKKLTRKHELESLTDEIAVLLVFYKIFVELFDEETSEKEIARAANKDASDINKRFDKISDEDKLDKIRFYFRNRKGHSTPVIYQPSLFDQYLIPPPSANKLLNDLRDYFKGFDKPMSHAPPKNFNEFLRSHYPLWLLVAQDLPRKTKRAKFVLDFIQATGYVAPHHDEYMVIKVFDHLSDKFSQKPPSN